MHRSRRLPPAHRAFALLATLAAFGWVVVAGGCQKVLFPTNLPRSQFETHDRMRQRYVPLEEPDVFGNPQPALRARLSQPAG
ncbi:MAG: hypothetical protein RL136_1776 [Planctomycetota bacterium]|jgi:energy-converting hydrogenase Eha subunit F